MSNEVAGRGRPPVYTGVKEEAIVKVIRSHGLTKGREFLATIGVQLRRGLKREKINISLPTLGKIAKRNYIQLQRGRPLAA